MVKIVYSEQNGSNLIPFLERIEVDGRIVIFEKWGKRLRRYVLSGMEYEKCVELANNFAANNTNHSASLDGDCDPAIISVRNLEVRDGDAVFYTRLVSPPSIGSAEFRQLVDFLVGMERFAR